MATIAMATISPSRAAAADLPARTSALLKADAQAGKLATELFEKTGTIVDVEPPDTFDGGFRGVIRIVPEPPVGTYRKHLAWTSAAMLDIDDVLASARTKAGAAVVSAARYRHRDIELHFFRSVNRTTPSAYASGWTIAYNVTGSLHTSADAVRETMFHELFHLNDGDHRDWSRRVLQTDYDAIVKKCGASVSCLAPYAPGDTKVRGGTYYAFQKDNGFPVREYAAELALRWYREHRAVLRGESLRAKPFKCGPAENARAWKAIVDEFFGVDLVPTCP